MSDAVTGSLDALLASLDGDAKRLDELKARIDQYKAELEKEKSELERAFNAANSLNERRAVQRQSEAADKRADEIREELLKIAAQLSTISPGWQQAAAKAAGRLILPFTDITGYCSCYTRKTQVLGTIATQLAAQQAIYAAELAAYNSVYATILAGNGVRNITGAVFTLLVWVWLGVATGYLLTTLVALIVIALALAVLVLYIWSIRSRMLAAQRQIALLTLLYYRIQQIPTCQKSPDTQYDETWLDSLLDQIEQMLHKGHDG